MDIQEKSIEMIGEKVVEEHDQCDDDEFQVIIDNENEEKEHFSLQEILDRTSYCTLVETEPGFLRRKTKEGDGNYITNSKIMRRIRYIIKNSMSDIVFETEEKAKDILSKKISEAYETFAPDEEDPFHIKSNTLTNGSVSFDIYVKIHNQYIYHNIIMQAGKIK